VADERCVRELLIQRVKSNVLVIASTGFAAGCCAWRCHFLLSGMEAGVFALNRLRIRRLARAGNRRAELLHNLLEKPERFLWTIW
jgi:CBS domain containing-hemolysin-like protein